MRSTRRYPSRKRAYRPKRKLFVISSEGEKTEPIYFKKFDSKAIRIHIVEDRLGNDPISLVKAAINYKREKKFDKKDETWIVVDTDFSHDTRQKRERQLAEAGKQCETLHFGYAVSNPCFEYWLLLHFEEKPAISGTERGQDKCIRLLKKKHYPNYDKSSYDPGKFTDKVETAITNAKKLDQPKDKSCLQNHGSTVYLLMEKIIENTTPVI